MHDGLTRVPLDCVQDNERGGIPVDLAQDRLTRFGVGLCQRIDEPKDRAVGRVLNGIEGRAELGIFEVALPEDSLDARCCSFSTSLPGEA